MDNTNIHDEHLGKEGLPTFEWEGNGEISAKYNVPDQATLAIN